MCERRAIALEWRPPQDTEVNIAPTQNGTWTAPPEGILPALLRHRVTADTLSKRERADTTLPSLPTTLTSLTYILLPSSLHTSHMGLLLFLQDLFPQIFLRIRKNIDCFLVK